MLLEARNVTKAFGSFKAVDAASVTLEQGDILGLIGPNGAGKSTLFNCLTGDLLSTSGKVLFEGHDITNLTPELRAHLRRQIGDVVAFEQNLAGCRQEVAGQAIEQRGFAGAVRPDQTENVALLQRHRRRIDGFEAAKGLCHIAGFKEHGWLPRRLLAPALCRALPKAA